ncbi:MAG: hypothetical protein G8345_00570 [Magnetococcales bacterium]|nr:hypothetical protein [Magnetococcales bacterium]NGZ25361.1 hypothetical protein [Magnetococcales bacterium]
MANTAQGTEIKVPEHLQRYYENGKKLREETDFMGRRISNSGPDCKTAYFNPEWSDDMLFTALEYSKIKG